VKRAIIIHRQDFAAVAALVILAIAVVGYILEHQPSFTFGQSYYTVEVPFQEAAAVTAGQGQSVDIAGVQVGQVGGVQLENGQAIVKMNIFKKDAPIYKNATVLLRPRTPLKDMYLALDPGSKDAGTVANGGMLSVGATSPDVDFDQILQSLDADSRNYLLLLLAGGAQAFQNPNATGEAASPEAVSSLRGVFKRFAPLDRDTQTFTKLLAERQANISRSIHNLQLVTRALGGVDGQLASLIQSSNTNFQAISSQDANLEQALTLLPGTLETTTQTLGKVQQFAATSGPTLQALQPFARAFGPALHAAQPLFKDTTPVIKNQLRPFSIAIQPLARTLAPAAAKLAKATPDLVSSVAVLNDLFNTLAYQPRGSEQGYLFWGSWLSHIADSLADSQDAQGAVVRGAFMGTCGNLNLFEVGLAQSDPALVPLLQLLNPPDWATITNNKFCPAVIIP
jgi:phospholipid/cholesterol/gamma-HCH transport system substrate-binding protein